MSAFSNRLSAASRALGFGNKSGCDGISQAATVKDLPPDQALAKIQANPKIKIVDVRASFEYRAGHIEGATLIPLPEIQTRAKSLLTNVSNLAGGTEQWRARGYRLVE